MPADMYSDAEEAPSAPATPPETESPADQDEGGDVAELPKTVLGGKEFKPGEEVVLEVVQVMENSVLVKYASEKGGGERYRGGKEEEYSESESGPQPPRGSMASMMY